MHSKLLAAYNKHVAATFDKQSFLEELVDDLDRWDFDMSTGVLSFGNQYQWSTQILGTQSEESNTWLWAWGNEASNIPENLLKAANSLLDLGNKNGLHELCEAQLPVEQYDGHFWSVIATGLCKANAYFRGPYESGAIFLLINDPSFPRVTSNPLARLRSTFLQAICENSITDHKSALIGHAQLLGLSAHKHSDGLSIKDSKGKKLTATFDEFNRLTGFSGEVAEIADLQQANPTSGPARPNSQTKEKVTFFQGWYRNFRKYYKQAIPFYGAIGIVIGLIAWPFTTSITAGIIAFFAFLILLFRGLIETDR